MHTCPYRAIYTRMYIHTNAHTRGDGYRKTQMEPPMCVRVHLGIRTCLDAQGGYTTPARAHVPTRACTSSWNLRVHSYAYMHSNVHIMYAIGDTRLVGAQWPLPTRTRTHARTRTCMESTRASICTYIYSHIYILTWRITSRDRGVGLRRRSRRSRAHARALMHKRARCNGFYARTRIYMHTRIHI
jgi:hypothetical protein